MPVLLELAVPVWLWLGVPDCDDVCDAVRVGVAVPDDVCVLVCVLELVLVDELEGVMLGVTIIAQTRTSSMASTVGYSESPAFCTANTSLWGPISRKANSMTFQFVPGPPPGRLMICVTFTKNNVVEFPVVSDGAARATLAAYAVSGRVFVLVSAVSNRTAIDRSRLGLVTSIVVVSVVYTFLAPAIRYAKYEPSYGTRSALPRQYADTSDSIDTRFAGDAVHPSGRAPVPSSKLSNPHMIDAEAEAEGELDGVTLGDGEFDAEPVPVDVRVAV